MSKAAVTSVAYVYSTAVVKLTLKLFKPEDLKYRVIEKDGRDLKPLKLKKYWTDLHVWRLKIFRKI